MVSSVEDGYTSDYKRSSSHDLSSQFTKFRKDDRGCPQPVSPSSSSPPPSSSSASSSSGPSILASIDYNQWEKQLAAAVHQLQTHFDIFRNNHPDEDEDEDEDEDKDKEEEEDEEKKEKKEDTREKGKKSSESTEMDSETIAKPKDEATLLKAPDANDKKPNSGRFLVYSGMPFDVFQDIAQAYDESSSRQGRLLWRNGDVWIYEIPDRVHEAAGSEFQGQFFVALRAHCIIPPSPRMGTPAVGFSKEPDCTVIPKLLPRPGVGHAAAADPQGRAWPTVVVEVAYSDGITDLRTDMGLWLGPNTGVQLGIGVLLYKRRANGTAQMVALRFTRANPTVPQYLVSFGNAPLHHTTRNALLTNLGGPAPVGVGCGGAACNAAGIAAYQFHVNAADVFHGAPGGVPGGVPAVINIDLFHVQQTVLAAY